MVLIIVCTADILRINTICLYLSIKLKLSMFFLFVLAGMNMQPPFEVNEGFYYRNRHNGQRPDSDSIRGTRKYTWSSNHCSPTT